MNSIDEQMVMASDVGAVIRSSGKHSKEEKISVIHTLKTLAVFFEEIISENKTFEIREDDRGYEVGDYLKLIEIEVDEENPDHPIKHTGRKAAVKVTYITDFKQQKNHVVMGIKKASLEGVKSAFPMNWP